MRMQGSGLLLSLIIVMPAGADVQVTRSVQMDGIAGFGGSTRQSTTWIATDKHRQETLSEGKPSMMDKMSGIHQPEITRLDKKVVWRLNAPKKSYTERPLAAPTQTTAKDSDSDNASDTSEGKPEEPTTRISRAEFKVTPIAEKKKIGTFECTGYTLHALLEMEDLQDHSRSEMKLRSTFWTTPEQGAVAQLHKEETAYAQAYARAIGITSEGKAALEMLGGSMFAALANSGEKELSRALADMPKEMKKIQGYPIQTRVEWYSKESAQTAAADAEPDSAEIPTNAQDALGSLAGGLFKKKMEKNAPPKTEDGQRVFGATTEVKSISVAAISGETFDIPAGFKKSK